MTTKIEALLRQQPKPFLSDTELADLLKVSDNQRYGQVKRALQRGDLIHIKRCLYALADYFNKRPLENYELAQWIYGPSYISLESALSFHGLIPEAVYATTSVTSKFKREFKTPYGLFVYYPLPLHNFFTQVKSIESGEASFFMATPWKAICDYIFIYKKQWVSLEPLEESLRIEIEDLPPLTSRLKNELIEYYQRMNVTRFLKGA